MDALEYELARRIARIIYIIHCVEDSGDDESRPEEAEIEAIASEAQPEWLEPLLRLTETTPRHFSVAELGAPNGCDRYWSEGSIVLEDVRDFVRDVLALWIRRAPEQVVPKIAGLLHDPVRRLYAISTLAIANSVAALPYLRWHIANLHGWREEEVIWLVSTLGGWANAYWGRLEVAGDLLRRLERTVPRTYYVARGHIRRILSD